MGKSYIHLLVACLVLLSPVTYGMQRDDCSFCWDYNLLPFKNDIDGGVEKALRASNGEYVIHPEMSPAQQEWVLARSVFMATETLHGNVRQGNIEWVATLIRDYRIPVDLLNRYGETALQFAARARNFAMIDILISLGADIFIRDIHDVMIFEKLSQDVQHYLLKHYPFLRNRFK